MYKSSFLYLKASIYLHMSTTAGKTTEPNWLHFFEGTIYSGSKESS